MDSALLAPPHTHAQQQPAHLHVVQQEEGQGALVRVVHRLHERVARGLVAQSEQVLARHAPAEGEVGRQRADAGEYGRLGLYVYIYACVCVWGLGGGGRGC
jgi:hypothetical protein